MRKMVAVTILAVFLRAAALATGILTPFVECSLNDIEPGKVYRVNELSGVPLAVKNTGRGEVTVVFRVSRPNEPGDGFEAIPDTGWISAVDESLTIAPGEWGKTDLLISIPAEREYFGRRFRADLLITTVGEGKVQAGLKSRIAITTAGRKSIWTRIRGVIGL